MAIGKKRPNGPKIVELRKQKELTQDALARRAGYSERLLRDIERNNHPVPATTITAIATALGTTPAEITLSTPDETPNASASLLKLRVVRSATELIGLADSAHGYEWKLKVEPSVATAEDMRQVMTIVARLVEHYITRRKDEFDKLPFGEIVRVARLQELLEKLRANGVGVLAGSYVRQSLISKEVCFRMRRQRIPPTWCDPPSSVIQRSTFLLHRVNV
jgi:transcriptional regulator with XRE-family HTH domain